MHSVQRARGSIKRPGSQLTLQLLSSRAPIREKVKITLTHGIRPRVRRKKSDDERNSPGEHVARVDLQTGAYQKLAAD